MSKYTTEVRFICESLAGLTESVGFDKIDEVITKSSPKIFSSYPIYDEAYRDILNSKILKHYYTREICEETYGLWKLRLNAKMEEIMPYYNEMYKSAMINFNPMYDTDIEVERNNDNTRTQQDIGNSTNSNNTKTTTTGNQNSKNTQYNYFSDTPQGRLDETLEQHNYLTSANKNTSDTGVTDVNTATGNSNGVGTFNTNSTANTTDKYIERIKGKRGASSYSYLLKEYRETIINIDMMIIEELGDLFFKLW